ncbi:uncharacterized protein UTRI_06105 [Ustilago trichophora]|uniref:Uncharacterized protein n=1 Tax=Ustilago trichophora TaxID=86804 RepID=A0A5C3EHS0_9BASI|nr:uncharacterized protein UTRI_06105 [Ustilago trichophora]
MSSPHQNAPRMRRHKRRINDDGSELAHAVRAFVDDTPDDATPLFARQADGFNGIGPGRGSNAPPMGGGGGAFGPDDPSSDSTAPTTTRGSTNTNVRPTPTSSSTSSTRNLFPTTTASSSSRTNFIDSILSDLTATSSSSSSTSSTPSSTSTSSSTTPSSSSTRSSSTSSSTSSVSVSDSDSHTATTTSDPNNGGDDSTSTRNNIGKDSTSSSRTSIVPITATAVVTSTPTASIAAATASSSPKSSTSSAGPIIGIVAGALVGVVVLSGLVGFLFKKYNKKDDPYEANPFDRDAFQRHSAMIPDHYESDAGHGGAGGAGGMSPEMSEHYQYNNFGPQYESGISAGAAGVAAGAAMGGMAHNENGGPRPPTMFAKHAAGVQQNQPQVGGYYKDGDFSMPQHSEYHAPPSAAFASGHHADQHYLDEPGFGSQRSISPAPQLPPLAAFGGDPYSIAGVGRGQQQAQNVANPYAHLDRSHGAPMGGFTPGAVIPNHHQHHTAGSGSVSSGGDSADQRHASISAAEALAAGLAHQSSLNRSASPNYAQHPQHDTAGRPSTSEGRSGTPDIPNVQQTYALPGDNATGDAAVGGHRISAGSQDLLKNPFENSHPQQHLYQHSQQQQQGYDANNQQLQVRNLVPNGGGLSAGQRPVSTASSFADPEDAYGGVY